jgi:hypothetical protein
MEGKMKRISLIVISFIFLLISFAFALTPSTGDKVLDNRLDAVNAYAEKDMDSFVTNISTTYHVDTETVQGMLNKGLTPADVYMTLRVAQLTGQPPAQVEKGYLHNKAKGWGVIAKSFGIKPGSKDFQSLKTGARGITGKEKSQGHEKGMSGKGSGKSSDGGHGKGGSGGDGHGNGGGKGK